MPVSSALPTRLGLITLTLLLLALPDIVAAGDQPAGATAGQTSHITGFPWHGMGVDYDPAHWRVHAEPGAAHISFVCIAPDCQDAPYVLVQAWRLRNSPDEPERAFCRHYLEITEEPGRDAKPIDLGEPTAGGLNFTAVSMWSGCRAADAPIYDACAEANGYAYRFSTRLIAYGCNFDPTVSQARFVELLKGARIPPPGSD